MMQKYLVLFLLFSWPITAEIPAEVEAELALPKLEVFVLEEQQVPFQKTVNGCNILLVDDDPVNLQSAATILKIGGYGVAAVNSGKAALEEINKRQDYALVILDVIRRSQRKWHLGKLRLSPIFYITP